MIFLDYAEELYYSPEEAPEPTRGPRGLGRLRGDVRAIAAALAAGGLPLTCEDAPAVVPADGDDGSDPSGARLEGHGVAEGDVGGRCACAGGGAAMEEALRVGDRHMRAELNCDGIHMGAASLAPLERALRAVAACHGVAL